MYHFLFMKEHIFAISSFLPSFSLPSFFPSLLSLPSLLFSLPFWTLSCFKGFATSFTVKWSFNVCLFSSPSSSPYLHMLCLFITFSRSLSFLSLILPSFWTTSLLGNTGNQLSSSILLFLLSLSFSFHLTFYFSIF